MGLACWDQLGPFRALRWGAGSLAAACLLALGAGEAHAAVECGDTITQDRKLTKDLTDCPGVGLVIGAPNVTLDLNGHRLDGVGESNGGILNSAGHDNVLIKGGGGGRITQFGRGIEMNGTQGSRIKGIGFKRADNQFSSVGVFLNNSSDVAVTNNSLAETDEDDAIGILLQGTTGVEVVGNRVRTMLGPDSVGIRVSLGGQDNSIEHNVVNTIRGRGIQVSDSDGTSVFGNRVIRGRDRGIEIHDGSADTLVKRNTVLKSEDGILVLSDAGGGSRILKNTARRNEEDGIEVDVDDASIGRSLVVDNADWGIEANAGVTDLGGNRAAGNGEAAQCLNVVCTPP